MLKEEDLILTLFSNDEENKIVYSTNNFILRNINNNKHLKNFLGKIFTPLRYTYIWDIKILTTFVKIIKFFDLPFRFDLDKKNLWRYNAKPYGSYFDKKKRSFVSFFSMGLKKNIGILMPFLMNYPSKSNLLHVVDWHKFSFLFENTLQKNINYNLLKNYNNIIIKDFFPIKDFNKKLLPITTHILNKLFHRSINLSDIDIDPWLTTFDYRYWTNDIYDHKYKKSNLSKLDFSWGVHKSFITSSFFITSFDTRIILYPELYFKYINKNYNQSRFFQLIKIFNQKYYKNFYLKIFDLFNNFLIKKFNNFLYKINFNFFTNYSKKSKNFFFFLLLYYNIIYNKKLLPNMKKFIYIYKPSLIKKSILIKNYYYLRSKKYNKNSKIYLSFRLYYAKKIPIISKYSKITSFSTIFLQNIFRSFYSNYYYYYVTRISKFWNYFFTFFLQNIKKRFFILNYKNFMNNNYIYDLLLFIKKFIFFNRYLRRYFNSFNQKKIFVRFKNNKKKKKNFIHFLLERDKKFKLYKDNIIKKNLIIFNNLKSKSKKFFDLDFK